MPLASHTMKPATQSYALRLIAGSVAHSPETEDVLGTDYRVAWSARIVRQTANLFPNSGIIPGASTRPSTTKPSGRSPLNFFTRRLGREDGEERRRHLRREFLEYAHRTRCVPFAGMDHGEVDGAEAPIRHHFDEPSIAQEFGLHYRRKVADAHSREQRCRETGVVVHR